MRDLSEYPAHLKARWWFVAIQAVIALVVVTLALAVFGSSSNVTTTHLVLRPASSLPATQVPSAIDGLRPDGSLVQTVLHVLGSDRLLQTAAGANKIDDISGYSINAAVQPGSAFFDQKVTGPNGNEVETLARGLSDADTAYITSAYSAYSLDIVGADSSKSDSFPPKPAVALLALMVGAVFGLGTVFADWWFRGQSGNQPQPVTLNLENGAAAARNGHSSVGEPALELGGEPVLEVAGESDASVTGPLAANET